MPSLLSMLIMAQAIRGAKNPLTSNSATNRPDVAGAIRRLVSAHIEQAPSCRLSRACNK